MNKRFLDKNPVYIISIIYLIMLSMNLLTKLSVDDFTYMINFSTKESITGFGELFPSIYAHYFKMNGRSIAHFLVQLFLYLPAPVFKLLNPAVFCCQIWLMYKISRAGDKDNYYFLLIIFSLLFIFEPAFGQVNLWLTGSCNYLWTATICFFYIYLYVNMFLHNSSDDIKTAALVLFTGLVAGGLQETASATAIFMNIVLILTNGIFFKNKTPWYYYISVILSVVSYAFMVFAPPQIAFKTTGFEFENICKNLIICFNLYKKFWVLIVLFIINTVIAIKEKINRKSFALSIILFVSSVISTFILVFASAHPERCLTMSIATLITANSLLLSELLPYYKNYLKISFMSLVGICVCICLVFAYADIYDTYIRMSDNERIIYECKKTGTDPEIVDILPGTKYSSIRGLIYINCQDHTSWPNYCMARYYGVDKITGRKP